MPLTGRSIRFDDDLYKKMMALAGDERSGSYHIRLACRQYLARLEPVSKPKQIKAKPATSVAPSADEMEFNHLWGVYEKKGNRKSSLFKFLKLSKSDKILLANSIIAYVLSTPDKQYRKDFEKYIKLECWNDEVTPNGQNKPNGPSSPNRQTPAQRTRAAAERWEADQASNVPSMGSNAGNIRPPVEQPVRGGADEFMGTTLEGDYTRSD